MKINKCLLLILIMTIISSSIVSIPVSAAWVTGDNLAPQAKLSAWPTGGDTGDPASVVDGVIGSGVGGTGARWYAYTNNIAEAYIEFEFPQEVTLGGAKIISGQTNSITSAPDTLESFAIQYHDGKNWTDAAEVTGNNLMTVSVRFPKMAKSKKFRLASRQNTAFRIRELELYEAIDTGNNMVRVPEMNGTKYHIPYEALANLGVVDSLNGFDPETIVTKEEFINYILKLSDNVDFNVKEYKSSYTDVEKAKYRDEIVYAELLGYIGRDGKDKFYPKKEITYAEAVQILLSMGGYDYFAEENGGYPTGYLHYASRTGLDIDVEPLKNGYLTLGEVVVLLYNATSIPVYEYTGEGEGATAYTTRNFLEHFRKIHHISGILYQTDIFGIPGTAPKGKVKIGGRYFNIGEADANEYVGYHVEAWYKESGDEKTLMYLLPSHRNKVYSIDKKDIGKNSDFSAIHYYTENGREKTLNIAYNSYVFLNSELGTAFTYDLYTGSGSVKLIDNDNDGKINVIFINSVRYMVVASVRDGIIYDKLGGKSVDTNYVDELVIMKDGFRCLPRDIKENDVLAVNEDKGKTTLNIYVSDRVVTGTITLINDKEELVKIDDKEYKYSDSVKSDLEVGMTADFHLEHNGVIVYVGNKIKTSLQYGVMIGLMGDSWNVRTKLMDTSGEINEYDLADKVYHNDSPKKAQDLLSSSELFDGGRFYTQVVKYQIGKDGKLKRLYTAGISAPDSRTEPALLEEPQKGIVRYKDSTQFFYSKPILTEYGLGRTLLISPETIVFNCPQDAALDEDYSVSIGANNLLSGEWIGTVYTYDLAYNNIPAVLLYKQNTAKTKIGAGTRLSVITGKQQVFDKTTDDTKLVFNMLTNGKEESVVLSNKAKYDPSTSTAEFLSSFGGDYDQTDLTTLDTGDVIQYGAENNEIKTIRILAKASDLKTLKANNTEVKIQTTGGTSATYLPAIDTVFGSAYSGDRETLVVEAEGTRYAYNCPDTVNVYIFDTKNNTVKKGTLGDLVYRRNSAGESKIFTRANAKKIQDIMIVE